MITAVSFSVMTLVNVPRKINWFSHSYLLPIDRCLKAQQATEIPPGRVTLGRLRTGQDTVYYLNKNCIICSYNLSTHTLIEESEHGYRKNRKEIPLLD